MPATHHTDPLQVPHIHVHDRTPADKQKAQALHKQLHIAPFLCDLLVKKGIDTFEKARHFFAPTPEQDLHDPFLMLGMDSAVARIAQAITQKEKILIYGDYDADGVCALAMLYHFLHTLSPMCVHYYIPDRLSEGYGTSDKGMDYVVREKYNLMITVDCGIRSARHVDFLNEHGIDCIITDHHLPDPQALPQAHAILNPHQINCHYPFTHLCGGGIVFKLIQALCARYYPQQDAREWIDIAALATVADMVSLSGENRVITLLGLQKMRERPHPALHALICAISGDNPPTINAEYLGFYLAPRINAAGRMTHAYAALDVFTESEPEARLTKARLLNQLNEDRKKLQSDYTSEAIALAETQAHLSAIVVCSTDWNIGVLGLVAGKLAEHFAKPVVVLSSAQPKDGILVGSARSHSQVHITNALTSCAPCLARFGGHESAAGLSVYAAHYDRFCATLRTYTDHYIEHEKERHYEADILLPLEEITLKRFEIIQRMDPFGMDNREPIFYAPRCRLCEKPYVFGNNHVSLLIATKDGKSMRAVRFFCADNYGTLPTNTDIDLLYQIRLNTFRGAQEIELKIVHAQVS